MRLTGSRAYARPAPTPTMPPGLVELMEGLAKDVLKHNPENVYEFCAAHMQKLIEIRDGLSPPKMHLSLEQKISSAQEKLRQRNRNRQLQLDRKVSEPSKHDHEAQPPKENIVESSAIQPVIHEDLIAKNELEIFHESNVITATIDTHMDDSTRAVNEVVEVSEVVHEVASSISNATHKLETSESSENAVEEVHDILISDINETSNVEVINKTDSVADETRGSTERVIEEVHDNLIRDTNETSNVEAIMKTDSVADVEEQSKVDHDIQTNHKEDHVEVIRTHEDNLEAHLNKSRDITSDIGDKVDEKADNLISEGKEKAVFTDELNEVASMVLLTSKAMAAFTNVSDNKTIEEEVEEPTIDKKEVKTDIQHEEVFLEKQTNQIVVDKDLNDIDEEQQLTLKAKPTDIQHNEKDVDIIESNGNKFTENYRTEDEHIVNQNREDILLISANSLESTVTHQDLPPMDTTTTESLENQVITVETVEKSLRDDSFKKDDNSSDRDVRNHQGDHEPQTDKELADIEVNLPEQEPAHSKELVAQNNGVIPDNTTVAMKEDSITDELAEHAAVSSMDLETAAITIQKVFRTFLFSKSRASTLDDTVNENSLDEDVEKKEEAEYALTSANINKERRTLGISRMDTVLQTVNEEKSLSLSDDSSLSSAATTIQAHVRGFLVRNRLASNKTASTSSLVNSDGPSISLDGDVNEPKKTILNIHIVPERGQFMSRDESLLTSIDLPLDNSPPSSINLHPLGYDKSERRKQLKREDAIQSISPPSNNSGKLSDEVDSVKETLNGSNGVDVKQDHGLTPVNAHDKAHEADTESCDTTLTVSSTADTVIDADTYNPREILSSPEHNVEDNRNHEVVTSSDETDVVTPSTITAKSASVENDHKPKLVHSGEFHDIVLQTQVKRSEASVVSGE